MPKDNIDYSETIIYKICCKDHNITDIYVGHTTNFTQRRYAHKIACSNNDNKLKIYTIIRCNGGWENWDMIEIAKYNCKDSTEARIKEQEHYKELKATLNSCPPYTDKAKYYCKLCNTQCASNYDYIKHSNTNLHKSKIDTANTDIFTQKYANNFICDNCDFKCSKRSDWDRHILTRKHKNTDILLTDTDNFTPKNTETFLCSCGKNYKHRQSLFNHKKKCYLVNKTKMIIDVIKDDKNVQDFLFEQNKLLIEQLSQQNKSLMEQNTKLFEIAQTANGVNNQIGTMNNNVNCNNKFNINVFLNETCKDAINLTDFVNQITLSLEDLEETSKVGYAEGISNVFIRNLKDIDYKQRPIHCNDYKREVLYIKDDNQWVKDNKDKLTNAIKVVANKNIKQIPNWQKANPEYNNPKSKQNDKYMKMLCEVMSGSSKEEQQKNYNKIIKNISKEVIIDKDMFTS
jgi:hypothetical protein